MGNVPEVRYFESTEMVLVLMSSTISGRCLFIVDGVEMTQDGVYHNFL